MSQIVQSILRMVRPDRARTYVVLKECGLAYGRVPKAANSSIKLSLHDTLMGEQKVVKDVNTDRFWREFPGGRADLLTAGELAKQYPDAFVFTFTRNPFARVASCYYDKIALRQKPLSGFYARHGFSKDMSFAAFVEKAVGFSDAVIDKHLQSQVSVLSYKGAVVPEFVGRVETIAEDWARLQDEARQRCGVELGRMRDIHNTRSRRPATGEVFSDEGLVRLVEERYAGDFEAFYPGREMPG